MTEKHDKDSNKPVCGIVMPISEIDGRPQSHWEEVREIIKESIHGAGFEANLVSEADHTGVILKQIVQNLYDNPILVCDVSGKNPNVMFEFGIRLAFDKPTVIIKDDCTDYCFDTGILEHLEYPRDLRFKSIVGFKKKLTEKIKATYHKSIRDKEYSPFIKHFGKFTIAKIHEKEIPSDVYLRASIEELKGEVKLLASKINARKNRNSLKRPRFSIRFIEDDDRNLSLCFREQDTQIYEEIQRAVQAEYGLSFRIETLDSSGRIYVRLNFPPGQPDLHDKIKLAITNILMRYF